MTQYAAHHPASAHTHNEGAWAEVLEALISRERVSGLTHDYYRYPARFSPVFVRRVIKAFTVPGDLVFDPFMGGGTTAVEALAAGRRFAGSDISGLATFVARAKTTLITERQANALVEWAQCLSPAISADWHKKTLPHRGSHHIPWQIRKTLDLGLRNARLIVDPSVRRLARASLLRVAQWALDGRRELPGKGALLTNHRRIAERMARAGLSFSDEAVSAFQLPRSRIQGQRVIQECSASDVSDRAFIPAAWGRPRLILTSPPYHGVHVLYHRWQVQGRREISTPSWVVGEPETHSASHYTLGGRSRRGVTPANDGYFQAAERAFTSIGGVCNASTLLVQLVGFSNSRQSLPVYREMMISAGFEEVAPDEISGEPHSLKRRVPNRKWYMDALQRTAPSSDEFLLVHRRRLAPRSHT